ncbi:MAG: hypothetical protein R2856_18375 [Caldilineaceae bacterium]
MKTGSLPPVVWRRGNPFVRALGECLDHLARDVWIEVDFAFTAPGWRAVRRRRLRL